MTIAEIAILETTDVDSNCTWCGGSGWWTDPVTKKKWPCNQCNQLG